jgi:hypothetical protein
MKVCLFLVGLIVGGGIAAGASDAQEFHQTTGKGCRKIRAYELSGAA